jgi:PhnB protein
MTVRLNPYLSFRDDARAAMEHYRSIFGGELTLSTFGETGMSQDPADADKVLHAQLEAPNGLWLMGSDTPGHMEFQEGARISVSLSGDDEATLRGWWDGLADGGSVTVPLEKAPWGDTFGMLTDRFGIAWLVNIAGSADGA